MATPPIPTDRSALRAEISELADKAELTLSEETRFEQLLDAAKRLKQNALRSEARTVVPSDVDFRTASRVELRDAAMALVEAEGRYLAPAALDQVDSLLRSPGGDVDGSVIAKRILLTENDAYRSGFHEGRHPEHAGVHSRRGSGP